ncbi:hypothetical protein D3C73_1075450 [compost metagenome]
MPFSRLSTANSKIRMAFFAASATSMVRPIWKYTSLLRPRISTASNAPKMAKGTASSTPTGNDHFSYCAARIRKTITRPKMNTCDEAPPLFFSSKASPLRASA